MKKVKKRNRHPHTSNQYRDTHHILWPRHDWNKGWAKALRTHWYLRVDIPMRTLHRTIHHEMARVPVPRAINIKDAMYQLSQLEKHGAIHPYDTLEKRLYVLMALFDCCEPATHAALEQQYNIVRKFYKKTSH